MKQRISKILAASLAFLLIGLLLYITNSFTGNPISATIATYKIKAYAKQNYPDENFTISKASYNFKGASYYSKVSSKTSKDTTFNISVRNGKVSDDYESEVTSHMTTYRRLSNSYNDTIEDIVNKDFPYKTTIVIGDFGKSDAEMNKLTLDMPYDPSNLPSDTTVTVYTICDIPNYPELEKRLLKLASIMKAHNIHPNYYSLILEMDREKDKKHAKSLYLYDFPAEKLDSENLIEAIKLHQINWEEDNKK